MKEKSPLKKSQNNTKNKGGRRGNGMNNLGKDKGLTTFIKAKEGGGERRRKEGPLKRGKASIKVDPKTFLENQKEGKA